MPAAPSLAQADPWRIRQLAAGAEAPQTFAPGPRQPGLDAQRRGISVSGNSSSPQYRYYETFTLLTATHTAAQNCTQAAGSSGLRNTCVSLRFVGRNTRRKKDSLLRKPALRARLPRQPNTALRLSGRPGILTFPVSSGQLLREEPLTVRDAGGHREPPPNRAGPRGAPAERRGGAAAAEGRAGVMAPPCGRGRPGRWLRESG